MSKLDDLLYGYRGDVEFLDDLRRGKFDPAKGELVKAAIQEVVDKILESNVEEKWEIGNLCEVFYYVSAVLVENNCGYETDLELENFDNEIHGIIGALYPESMML